MSAPILIAFFAGVVVGALIGAGLVVILIYREWLRSPL